MSMQQKIDFFFFLLTSGYFSLSLSIFHLEPYSVLSLSGKLEVLGPHRGGSLYVRGRHCPPFQIERRDKKQGKVE